MIERRDNARLKLSAVNNALEELLDLALSLRKFNKFEITNADFVTDWNKVLDKHDLNYNDTKRWSTE